MRGQGEQRGRADEGGTGQQQDDFLADDRPAISEPGPALVEQLGPASVIAATLREQAPRFSDPRLRDLALRAASRWDRLGGRPLRPAPAPE